jgi:hypothetical protein
MGLDGLDMALHHRPALLHQPTVPPAPARPHLAPSGSHPVPASGPPHASAPWPHRGGLLRGHPGAWARAGGWCLAAARRRGGWCCSGGRGLRGGRHVQGVDRQDRGNGGAEQERGRLRDKSSSQVGSRETKHCPHRQSGQRKCRPSDPARATGFRTNRCSCTAGRDPPLSNFWSEPQPSPPRQGVGPGSHKLSTEVLTPVGENRPPGASPGAVAAG